MDATLTTPRARANRTTTVWDKSRISLMLDRALFHALVSLVVLVSFAPDTFEAWREGFLLCAAFALASLRSAGYLLHDEWRVREGRLMWPLLALAAFSLVQTLPLSTLALDGVGNVQLARVSFSADPYESKRFAFRLLAFLLTGEMLLCALKSTRRLRALVCALAGIGVLSALFAIFQKWLPAESSSLFFPYAGSDQGYGQMGSHNQFAFLMEMSLGLVMGLMLRKGARREHLLIHLSLALLLMTALVLTTSRGGLLGLFCLLMFFVLMMKKARGGSRGLVHELFIKVVPLSLILMLLMSASVLWIGGEAVNSRIEKLSSEVSALDGGASRPTRRLEIWKATWLLIKDHPAGGVGFGGYWIGVSPYLDASGENVPYQAHNDYLEILASGGIIAGAFALWFILAWTRRAWRSLSATDDFSRACAVGAMAGLFAVFVHSAVDFGLHQDINALFCTALLVIPLAVRGLMREEKKKARAHHSGASTKHF